MFVVFVNNVKIFIHTFTFCVESAEVILVF